MCQGCAQKWCSFHLGLFDVQIRDLDKGTFGFVQLAVDLTTGEQVAIKFIERSQEVRPLILHETVNYIFRSRNSAVRRPVAGAISLSASCCVGQNSGGPPPWRHQFALVLTDQVHTGFEICGARNPQS